MNARYYGVDVSKATLEIAQGTQVVQLPNRSVAIRRFVQGLVPGSVVGMEATNVYHLPLADRCHAAGLRVYVINPRVTRHYREVLALHGHTDRMDARALASFLERHHPELRPYTPKAPSLRLLGTLLRRRQKLVEIKGQLQQSMAQVREIAPEIRQALLRLDQAIAKIERLIDGLLEMDDARKRLQGIPGIGPLVSAALSGDLQAGQFRSADAFVKYYGLDPQPRDSGRLRGQRRISKRGQRLGRTLLYIAAMSAVRTATWKPYYHKLLARGLAPIQAFVAIARRLARTAWSMYTYQTQFDPARLRSPVT